jgi:hypothetical protein
VAPFEGADLFRLHDCTSALAVPGARARGRDQRELDVRVFTRTNVVLTHPSPQDLQGVLASSAAAAFYRTLLVTRLSFLHRTQLPAGVALHFEFTPMRRVLSATGPLMSSCRPERQVQSPWLTESLLDDRYPFLE